MTAPLRVDPAELRGKAATLDVPLPATPGRPQAPCGLALANVAVAQITAEGDGMTSFITAGQQEATLLSAALKAAATTYEATDQAGAEAIDDAVGEVAEVPVPKLDVPIPTPQMPLAACPAPPGYLAVEVAAEQIAQPDQAATLDSFAADWATYAATLATRAEEFDLDGVDWDGSAAEVAGNALRSHKTWLQDMARAAVEMSDHAKDLARVHRLAVASHPTVADVEEITTQLQMTTDTAQMAALLAKYKQLQDRSEEVLATYAAAAVVTPVKPPSPPIRKALETGWDKNAGKNKKPISPVGPTGSDPGNVGGGGGTGGGGPSGAGAQQPRVSPAAAQTGQPAPSPANDTPQGTGGSPAGGGSPSGAGKPGGGGGLPSGLPGGGLPTGDGIPDAGLPEPGLDDPGISPAGAGGGSGGGAGGGAPSLPLQPSVGAETVAPGPSGGARGGGSGAIPASAMGPGMGGMGGGMGGMGHGGGGMQGKEKRRDPRLAQDEELYVEDRPYTEPVIGNRRRKDLQDKESK